MHTRQGIKAIWLAGIKYDLRQQAGVGTWQLFTLDPDGAKVELDFDPQESL